MMRNFTRLVTFFLVASLFSLTSAFGQLSGNYTIGASGNYANFNAAVSALHSQGVSGPVVFTVEAATFTEQVSINSITGASLTNTISFVGASQATTVLQYTATSSSSRHTLKLNGADYMIFKDMTIKASGSTYAWVVHMLSGADHNTFDNVKFHMTSSSTSYDRNGVIASSSTTSYSGYGNNANYNLFANCEFDGGYYGARLNGSGSSSPNNGNDFYDCYFTNQYYYPLYMYYQRNSHCIRNTVRNVSSTSGYGIYYAYSSNDTILYNDIQTQRYGMYVYYENYYVNGNSLVANNMIYNFTQSYNRGIYFYRATNTKLVFNTIWIEASSSSNSYCGVYAYYNNGCEIKSNIFINDGGSYGYCIYENYGNWADGSVDYNIYYSTGSYFIGWQGSAISSLTAWKAAAPTMNEHSLETNPHLTSTTNMHLTSSSPLLMGPNTDLLVDIDGDPRGNTFSVVGADRVEVNGLDAALVSIDEPTAWATGNNTLKVTYANLAKTPISSIDLYYQVDNNTAVSALNVTPSPALGQGDGDSYTFTTPISLTPFAHTIKVWVADPNSTTPDDDPSNDLITSQYYPPMSGIYTIGGTGADFSTFTDALVDLNGGGVSGPVTFMVAAGTYTEQISIGQIMGASATNTISFIGDGLTTTILQYAAPGSSPRHTLKLDGADYVTFSHMSIRGTGGTYAWAVHLINGADYNTFDSCKFDVGYSSSSNKCCVIASSSPTSYSSYGDNANYNTFNYCQVYGGYFGIRLNGSGSSSLCYGNDILDCYFDNQYYYPLYMYYNGHSNCDGNTIRNVQSTGGYGIYYYYGSSDTIINNDIQTQRYGMYTGYENYYVNGHSLVANNAIYNFGYTYNRGIYAYRAENTNYYHNTFRTNNTGSSSTSYCGMYLYYNTGCEIKNNIFYDGGTYGYSIYRNGTGGSWASGSIDYNCYYNQGSSSYNISWGSNYTSLAAWQAAEPGLNANSWEIDPGMVSATDFHLTPASLSLSAPSVGIDHDIDGQTRGNTTVYIGADEPEPMVFDSFYVQDVSPQFAFLGQIKVKMMHVKTVIHGVKDPLTVSTAYFSTTGCSDPDDVAKFRLYNQDGAPLDDMYEIHYENKPNGIITITAPTGATASDIIDIYAAYDVELTATINDSLDISFDSAMIDGIMRYPVAGNANPTGSTYIVAPSSYADYCDVVRVNNGGYAIGTRRIKFEDIDQKSATLANGFAPNNTAVQFSTSPVPTVYRKATYPITIQHGELNPQSASVFIDLNNDGYFTAEDRIVDFLNMPEASISNGMITIPCDISTGVHRMRVASDYGAYTPVPCGSTNYGEVEDFLVYVAPEDTPVVTVTNKDTGYVDGLVVFKADVSVQGDIMVLWDYDNDGMVDDTSDMGEYYFNTTGLKTVGVKAISQGCEDTIISPFYYTTITIVTPTTPPVTNFIADNNIIVPNTTVNFTDLTTNGPFSWRWVVTPDTINGNAAYAFLGSDMDREPSIVFNEVGDYTIKLVTQNVVGYDSTIKVDYISVLKEEVFCADVSSRATTGYIFDNGGANGNYSNPVSGDSYTCAYTIKPDCATSVTLDFLDFDVASNTIGGCANLPSDGLKIWDGLDTNGIPLHLQFLDGNGDPIFPDGFTNGPGNASIGIPPSVTATSGSLYLEFFVNCGAVGSGFEAKWTAQTYTPQKPVAGISGEDTVYTNQTAYLESSSIGALEYFWDMDNDGWADLFTENVSWQYTSPGVYTVTLIAYICGKADTTTFDLTVLDPIAKPVVDFYADYTNVTTVDPVNLMEDADETVYEWQWEISPMTYSILDGDLDQTQLQVLFNQTGSYTVKLVCTNAKGQDSLIKVNYIYVYAPCKPSVGNLNPDVGISQFVMQNILGDTLIINSSSIGMSGYTDYSTTDKATVAKGGNYTLTLDRNTNFNKITRSVFIDFNQDGDFIDPGEEVAKDYNATTLSWTVNINIPLTVPTGLAKLRIATNAGQLHNKGCGPNFSGEFEDYGLEITEDINKPVITLIGGNYIVSNSCAPYVELGYSAEDAEEGDITNKVVVTGSINPTVAGVYEIKYNVTDAQGNEADEVVREVEVLADIVKPKANPINYTAGQIDTVAVGSIYNDPGYNPTDNCSGVKSHSSTSFVDGMHVGLYQVMYIVEDNAGNIDTSYRDVYVHDGIDPTIALLGNNPIKIEAGNAFVDPGASVSDNYYTGLTYDVIGTVNVNKLGTYFLSYCVTDSSGNGPICVDRTVIVEDNTAPIITLKGDNPYTLEVFKNFKDPGVSITDNYYDYENDEIILTTNSNLNTYELGTYTVTYQAVDGSGNASTIATRTIEIVDMTAPSIELVGPTTVTIERWQDYVDAGVNIHDNYYDEDDLTVDYNSNGSYPGNTYEEGLYSYTYKVCDPSGNCSQEIFRTIYVVPSTSSIEEEGLNGHISMYPNPADNYLSIAIDLPDNENVSLSIINTLGEVVVDVFNGSVKTDLKTIDVSQLASGVYYLRINMKEVQINEKFIIAH
jgi:PKD repeat protein